MDCISFPEKYMNVDCSYNNSDWAKNNFIEGQSWLAEGKTNHHKVFVTLYDKNEIENYLSNDCLRTKYISWLCPIEQALMYKTLSEYRKNLAILKNWGAYSDVFLILIPKDTEVKFRAGLVGGQSFPTISGSLLEHNQIDINSLTASLNNINNISQIVNKSDIYEYAKGGSTQFQIIYIEPKTDGTPSFYIINLQDAIDFPHQMGKRELLDKATAERGNWESLKPGEVSHFNHLEYKSAKLKIHESLKNLNFITQDDYNHLEKLIHR